MRLSSIRKGLPRPVAREWPSTSASDFDFTRFVDLGLPRHYFRTTAAVEPPKVRSDGVGGIALSGSAISEQKDRRDHSIVFVSDVQSVDCGSQLTEVRGLARKKLLEEGVAFFERVGFCKSSSLFNNA